MEVFILSRPPFSYEEINIVASEHIPNIHCTDTMIYQYFKRMLYQRACSVFKIKCPDYWAKNYINACLWGVGYYAVINTNKFGVIPSWCTIGGYDVMYQPSYAFISNPLFRNSGQFNIGTQCALIRLSPDYGGVMDTISYYANEMALAAECIGINFLNSHTAYVFGTENKSGAETMKKMYDQVSRGEPAVVVDQKFFDKGNGEPAWTKFDMDVKKTYIVSDVLDDLQKLLAMFDTEMGIPNNKNAGKKERQVVDEVNANNVETYTKMDMFLETLKECCKKARDMFGIELDYDWRFPPESVSREGGVQNENRNAVNTGDV